MFPRDLEDETLELGPALGQLPLLREQRVHQPAHQLAGEEGRVRLIQVLEVTQSLQAAGTQGVDETTQVTEPAQTQVLLVLVYHLFAEYIDWYG